MKTAMQELMQWMEETEFLVNQAFIDKVFECLEKEKEQIIEAYSDGAKGGANGTKGQHENGWVSTQMKEKYYNQTFNQNK